MVYIEHIAEEKLPLIVFSNYFENLEWKISQIQFIYLEYKVNWVKWVV